jgi:glycosyltransferase involved in cell wall biosynthesis
LEKNLLEKEKVSVIIPVYKVEAYIRECLDSVIQQTYKNLEIILVDDGSPDQCGRICDEYARRDARIQVIHKENAGVSAARNTGIDVATGTYLIFADSDDVLHEQMVETYMQYVDEKHLVLCDHVSDMEKTKQQLNVSTAHLDRSLFMELFIRDYVNPPYNKIYETRIIKENQIYFPENKNLGEDLIFNLNYMRASGQDYFIIHAPLYYYRPGRTGSLSNSVRKDLFQIQKESFGYLKTFLQEEDIWTEENADIYYGLYWDRLFMTWRQLRKGNVGMAEDPVWKDVWNECRTRGLCTWKRRIKNAVLILEHVNERR